MKDYRTEDQKVAAVAASMTMAGQPVTLEDEAHGRRILRGEISADEAVLEILEEEGLGDSTRAAELRRRITDAAQAMDSDSAAAPENLYGISDPMKLEHVAGRLATQRLFELENRDPLTRFTREDLVWVHSYLMQDIYPWAGKVRTTEVGAMGMAMCRAQFVDHELDRVIRDIGRKPPSTTDVDAAVITVADHWSEMTMVHPFQDGNSRTQRLFFDQMLRRAGWAVDWTQVNAEQVHAARYVGAATVDPAYLAQTLRPAVHPATDVASGTLFATDGVHDARTSAEIFHDMMSFRRAHPRGTSYELPTRS